MFRFSVLLLLPFFFIRLFGIPSCRKSQVDTQPKNLFPTPITSRPCFIMKLSAVIFLATLAAATPMNVETVHDGAAPILSSTSAETIPGHYIIKFKKDVSASAVSDHHSWVQDLHNDGEERRMELRKRGGSSADIFSGIKHIYKISDDFLGYAGHFDEDVIEQVRRHPDVSKLPISGPPLSIPNTDVKLSL